MNNDTDLKIINSDTTDQGDYVWLDLTTKECEDFKIHLKWDGCIDIKEKDGGYIHICDIGRFIEILKNVEMLGIAYGFEMD